mmetsp:Transcript_22128/g.46240  ORF Transcript_22128/g.46240 Transcript_22128/m.46240 type:complete len:358 (-) Transcript_22128:11-1084(-)
MSISEGFVAFVFVVTSCLAQGTVQATWLRPQDVAARLPLLDSSILKAEQGDNFFMRYVPEVERKVGEMHPHLASSEIIATEVLVQDIDLVEEKPTYHKDGFELSELSESALARLPNVTVDTKSIDGNPEICRYLGWTLDKIMMPSSHLYFLHVDRIVLRGTAADGPALEGVLRWPGAFNGHVDVDLQGEPMVSMGYNWIFKLVPFLHLVNVWIPMGDSQVRPLAFLGKTSVKKGDLAKWRQSVDFHLPCLWNLEFKCAIQDSDSFVVTTESAREGAWYYSSQMKRGQAFVFSSFESPHTSFGRPDGGGYKYRYSVEMRCAAFIVGRKALKMIVAVVFGTLSFWALIQRRKRNNRYPV